MAVTSFNSDLRSILCNTINIDLNLPQVSNGMHAANQEFSSVEANANDLTIISLTSMTIIKMIKMIITIIIRQMPMRATEWAPSQQRWMSSSSSYSPWSATWSKRSSSTWSSSSSWWQLPPPAHVAHAHAVRAVPRPRHLHHPGSRSISFYVYLWLMTKIFF